MGFIGFVFMVNIVALIYLTILKIIFWFKVRKARKASQKLQQQKRKLSGKVAPIDSERKGLDDARNLSRWDYFYDS